MSYTRSRHSLLLSEGRPPFPKRKKLQNFHHGADVWSYVLDPIGSEETWRGARPWREELRGGEEAEGGGGRRREEEGGRFRPNMKM